MSRIHFAVLGLCAVLAACGDQFVSNTGSSSSAGHANADAAGGPAGGSAGHDDDSAGAGEAGSEPGGGGGALANGGGVSGVSGASGASGAGGLPPELPQSGLLVWLRADRGIQQKDGHVQVWLDQSGNQTNASQLSVNMRPSYLANGFNGRPTLEFDGVGQFLKFGEGFGDFSKGLAGLIVAKPTASECQSLLELSNGSEVEDIAMGLWQSKWMYEVATQYIQTGNVDQQTFSLYSVNHRPSGTSELRINGSILDTLEMPLPNLPESGVRLNNFVGHTLYGDCAYFAGQISEIILYSRALTNNELSGIERYLAAHWALNEQDSPTPAP